jgi:hypothetical protein
MRPVKVRRYNSLKKGANADAKCKSLQRQLALIATKSRNWKPCELAHSSPGSCWNGSCSHVLSQIAVADSRILVFLHVLIRCEMKVNKIRRSHSPLEQCFSRLRVRATDISLLSRRLLDFICWRGLVLARNQHVTASESGHKKKNDRELHCRFCFERARGKSMRGAE